MSNNSNVKGKIKYTKYDKKITIIFLAILLLTLIYNMVFQGGSKISRIILAIFTIVATYLFFNFSFLKKSRASYISALIFIMLAMYLGNVLDCYTYIPYYDKILHLSSGIIICVIGLIIYAYFTKGYIKKLNPMFMVFFVMTFTIAAAGAWEIWEFTTDRLFGLQSQLNSLTDTMTDIICGTIGGIIALFWIYPFSKGKNNKMLTTIINEIIE